MKFTHIFRVHFFDVYGHQGNKLKVKRYFHPLNLYFLGFLRKWVCSFMCCRAHICVSNIFIKKKLPGDKYIYILKEIFLIFSYNSKLEVLCIELVFVELKQHSDLWDTSPKALVPSMLTENLPNTSAKSKLC